MLKGFSKGGNLPAIATCEVINLDSAATTCKSPPNFPETCWSAIGGLGFKENPIICGGLQKFSYENKCYSLENNEWASSFSMNSVRYYAAAAQLQDGKLLVIGGGTSDNLNNDFNDSAALNTAEILTEEGWESNIPFLPVTLKVHCMVTIKSTTVMVIGGLKNGIISRKRFFFTFGEKRT